MFTLDTQQAYDVATLRHQEDVKAAGIQRLVKRPRRGSVVNSVKLALTAILAIF